MFSDFTFLSRTVVLEDVDTTSASGQNSDFSTRYSNSSSLSIISKDMKSNGSLSEDGLISLRAVATLLLAASVASLLIGLVAVPLCAMNVVTNSAQRRDAYTNYLIGVSVGDGFDLLVMLITVLLPMIVPTSSFSYNVVVVYLSVGAAVIFRRGAIVLNTLASVERFFTLIFPFRSYSNFLSRYPRLVIVSVYGVTTLLHVSTLLDLRVVNVSGEVWAFAPSTYRLENEEAFLVTKSVSRATAFYGPLVISLVVNAALIVALKLHVSKQQDIRATRGGGPGDGTLRTGTAKGLSQKGHAQTDRLAQTCRLVLALSFSFFVLALPRTVSGSVSSFLPTYSYFSSTRYLIMVIDAFATLSQYLTEPCLFLISYAHSSQFRKTVARRLCRD